MNIDNLILALEHAKGLGAKTVSFYRVEKECKDNSKTLDFILDSNLLNINDMMIYGEKPEQIHLELPIKGI